jgi:hypothetical protein
MSFDSISGLVRGWRSPPRCAAGHKHFIAAEACMTLRRLVAHVMNGLAALLIAIAIFAALANVGIISRPSSEDISFGG